MIQHELTPRMCRRGEVGMGRGRGVWRLQLCRGISPAWCCRASCLARTVAYSTFGWRRGHVDAAWRGHGKRRDGVGKGERAARQGWRKALGATGGQWGAEGPEYKGPETSVTSTINQLTYLSTMVKGGRGGSKKKATSRSAKAGLQCELLTPLYQPSSIAISPAFSPSHLVDSQSRWAVSTAT